MAKYFKMPKPVKIMGRSSSITNSFINGVIPCIQPKDEEVQEALKVLGMESKITCAYCGGNYTEWDHLNPLIQDRKPTGYFSEIHNLVPACSTCNSSKGNKNWIDWITKTDSKYVRLLKGKYGYEERIEKLKEYERRFTPRKINFESIEGWKEYIDTRDSIFNAMRESQEKSNIIQKELRDNYVKYLIKNDSESEKLEKPKISELVNSKIRLVLEKQSFSNEEFMDFFSLERSKELFNLYYPLLTFKRGKDNKDRYYKKPIVVMGKKCY